MRNDSVEMLPGGVVDLDFSGVETAEAPVISQDRQDDSVVGNENAQGHQSVRKGHGTSRSSGRWAAD